MHDHDRTHEDHTRAHERKAAAPEAAGQDLGPIAEGLLGLQRDAGNQAVAAQIAQRRALTDGVNAATSGSGSSLPAPLRMALETHTGADLSSVRVHSGGAAAASASALSAEAYTVGNSIVLGQGAGDLASKEGQHRVAHEVEHVVQQRKGPVAGQQVEQGLAVSHPNDSFEQAAEASAQEFSKHSHQH